MGIYTRKKNRNGLKIISYSTVIIFIIAIFAYYYFKPNINYNFVNIQNTDNKELEPSDVSPSNVIFDSKNFVKYDQLDKNIEEFIRNNPGIILDVLRDFQSKQNQIEQKNKQQQSY